MRQDDAAADDRRPRESTSGDDRDRRAASSTTCPQGPRHRDGLPELRPVPAHDGPREHRASRCAARSCRKAEHRRARSREAAEMLELTDYLERKPGQLSGGQRQRVALGRAIVREPQRLPDGRAPVQPRRASCASQMRAEMQRCSAAWLTMVYVTHDQVEAMTMGDRIAVMRRHAPAVRHAGDALRRARRTLRRRLHRRADR